MTLSKHSKKILDQFDELERWKKNVMRGIENENLKEKVKDENLKTIKKTLKVKKSALETQLFCNDGPFLLIVLIELNQLFSISPKQQIAINVELDGIPDDIRKSLFEVIEKKRHNPSLKLKITITEALLSFIQEHKLSQLMRTYNLKNRKELSLPLIEILENHNFKK